MNVMKLLDSYDCEQLIFHNGRHGLKCVLAIHKMLGSKVASGGVRMMNYANEQEAILDAMKLARAMTRKSVLLEVAIGGAKCVIIGDPQKKKNAGLLHAFGDFLNSLDGKFFTGVDMGLNCADAATIRKVSPYIKAVGFSEYGLRGSSGESCAYGIYQSIKKVVAPKILGKENLKGVRFAIQGLGEVGSNLVKFLLEEGVKVIACDPDENKYKNKEFYTNKSFDFEIVPPELIFKAKCDIFAPCAMGSVINKKTIFDLPRSCKVIAGGANNPLQDEKDTDFLLKEKEIVFIPDFAINLGGFIHGIADNEGVTHDDMVLAKVGELVPSMVSEIHELAGKNCERSDLEAADMIIKERMKGLEHGLKKFKEKLFS